ncbi:MAG: phosphatase PAP2 family protein [Oscillospiraceae bacterium]|nr:phosphatase PAP2 family protein [Oscillospiraceae bacterium]
MNVIEAQILLFIQEHMRCDALTPLMQLMSRLGDAGMGWIIFGLVLLIFAKTRRGGLDMLLCLAACFCVCNLIIKPLAARIRPYEVAETLDILVSVPTDYSFPSGHTASSFACATALTRAFGKKGAWSFAFAALIALSRLYVGVHYPTDVLCGALLGAGISWITYSLLHRRKSTAPA